MSGVAEPTDSRADDAAGRNPLRSGAGATGARVAMHRDLDELAQALGRYMAGKCVDGLPGHFGDDLLEAVAGMGLRDVGRALSDLEAEDLVVLTPVIGAELPRVGTTVELFVACDAALTGHDPVEDSVKLARRLIEDPELGGRTADLEAAVGWERRRFNPAFALILPQVDEGRIRGGYQPGYPCPGVILVEQDVVRLRRYVRDRSR